MLHGDKMLREHSHTGVCAVAEGQGRVCTYWSKRIHEPLLHQNNTDTIHENSSDTYGHAAPRPRIPVAKQSKPASHQALIAATTQIEATFTATEQNTHHARQLTRLVRCSK